MRWRQSWLGGEAGAVGTAMTISAADGEDEDDGVTSGISRARDSFWSFVASRRSLWAWRKGEVVALGTVAESGGGGRSRVSSGTRLEGEGESRE